MLRNERTVHYTAEELQEKLARGEDESNYDFIDSLTEEELEASIDFEEEGYPIWESIVVRNRQPKQQLTIRFDQDVIDWFKDEGPGYQTRMNEVLRGYVDVQKRKTRAEARTGR